MDSHHTPAAQANKLGGGPSKNDGPAVQMKPEDHHDTISHGNDLEAQTYRARQAALIKEGHLLDAVQMDIDDLKRIAQEAGDPTRYDEAIKEMTAYAKCLQDEINKGGGGAPPSP